MINWTNFYKFYGRFEEIGLLYVGDVFVRRQHFDLDVLLVIEPKIYLISQMIVVKQKCFSERILIKIL